jgi:hypothetical protein
MGSAVVIVVCGGGGGRSQAKSKFRRALEVDGDECWSARLVVMITIVGITVRLNLWQKRVRPNIVGVACCCRTGAVILVTIAHLRL